MSEHKLDVLPAEGKYQWAVQLVHWILVFVTCKGKMVHRTAEAYGDRKYSLMREAPSLANIPSRSPRILASQISKLRWISLKLFLIELSALLVHILASAVSSSPKLLFAVSACSVLSFCLVSVALCWRWNASRRNSVCRCVLNSELSVESQGSLVCCTNTYSSVLFPAEVVK